MTHMTAGDMSGCSPEALLRNKDRSFHHRWVLWIGGHNPKYFTNKDEKRRRGVFHFILLYPKVDLFDLVSETNIRVAHHGAMSHLAGMAGLDLGNAKMWRPQKTGGPTKLATRTGQQRGPMIFFKHFDTLIRTSKKNVT